MAAEVLNERAVAVIKRVNAKLTGRDFGEVPAVSCACRPASVVSCLLCRVAS